MNNQENTEESLPNKLIPASFRKRLPLEEEVRKARKSLAYWWYRCLSLSDGYVRCCQAEGQGPFAALYGDMGDTRLAFSSWWIKYGRRTFTEQQPLKEVLILEPNKLADQHLERADALVLSIPLTMRKTTAMRKISRLLATAHSERPPIDIWQASSARRMIVKNKIRQATIEQLVKLWEMRQKYPELSLNELGVREGIEMDLMARTTEDISLPSESDERRRMTIAVSRQLKQARHLIDNAALGVFPSVKPPQSNSLSG